MLDTAAATKGLTALAEAFREIEHGDRERRVAAVQRAHRSVQEFEDSIAEVAATSEAIIAEAKAGRGTTTDEDLDSMIGHSEEMERSVARLFGESRSMLKRVLATLSEKDRGLFGEVRGLLERDAEAVTRLLEMLRDTRWALMAVRAERSSAEGAVEIGSAADIRRALLAR